MLCIYSVFNSNSINAQTNKISLKCYVELVGGKSTILYHYYLPETDKELFTDWLQQEYNSQEGNDRKLIYKVNECVEIKEKFKDNIANTLEESTNINR